MIYESKYWKEPLLGMAERLRAMKTSKNIDAEWYVQLEKDIFIGFYSMRKLLESVGKVTDRTKSKMVQVGWHPNRISPVLWSTSDRIEEHYRLDERYVESKNIKFVCGRIIHSFIFMPHLNSAGGLARILFTSDIDKDSKLYFLEVDDVIDVFEAVGLDSPKKIELIRDPNSGGEQIIVQ